MVDIYDALCSRRPYREAFTPDATLRIIEEQAGRRPDPALVRVTGLRR